ncbi:hypothetical protein [Aggregatilinea lenta]|uniref:hypothetical protein n=1 Tax=Aggregatilinea lenta TaxID=913108 RepID=UPI000E5AD69A|nr:hypothetical protein [Aggregatilinea lenta]
MAEPERLTLLCTADLQGDLDRLARVGTLIHQQRRAATGPVFVLDLGGNGSPDGWLWQTTEGRAPFVVLDAMGYDLAVAGGPEGSALSPEALAQLRESVTMTLLPWHTRARLERGSVAFEVGAGPVAGGNGPFAALERYVQADPAPGARLNTIGDPSNALLRIVVTWPAWQVHAVMRLDIAAAPPDPVVGAAIEFVVSEARAYTQRQGGGT